MNLKTAHAGTLESGDILVQIFPAAEGEGLTVNLDSSVAFQFGKQIKKVITETLQERGVTDAVVNATDKGALDCTIRARVTAAAVRATGVDVWND
ncbi:MAG: citrate lyase acyl carrier protein [Bacteroidales bacterium]|nr:citrate lyase acyl carrier protein [Bacteroidales bacterium]